MRQITRIIVVTLLAMVGMQATAQDTINRPRSNYLHTWPDVENDKELQNCFDQFVKMYIYGMEQCGEVGRAYYVESPTAVYGIAAVLFVNGSQYDSPEGTQGSSSLLDTSLSASFEYLRLYEPDSSGQGLNVLAEAPVFATDTPVYYFHVVAQNPMFPDDDPLGPRQVFEVYFDQPVTVTDTFFVGMTKFMGCDTTVNNVHYRRSWGIDHVYLSSTDPFRWGCADYEIFQVSKIFQCQYGFSAAYNYCYIHDDGRYFLFFPILTPAGSSALAAQAPEVLDRYVALQPNPATDRVTVTSSFGLTRIEVRDAAGRKLHDAPASGFSASLDLSRFPSGTLILTIHTPAGPATKKLLKP